MYSQYTNVYSQYTNVFIEGEITKVSCSEIIALIKMKAVLRWCVFCTDSELGEKELQYGITECMYRFPVCTSSPCIQVPNVLQYLFKGLEYFIPCFGKVTVFVNIVTGRNNSQTSYGDILWRHLMETSYGDILWEHLMEISYGDILWRHLMETSYGDILWGHLMETSHGDILWGLLMPNQLVNCFSLGC